MSSSNPPNPNTPPVFNNDAFNFNTGDIDTAYLNANYLRFPTAQGAETLQNIQVVGSATFNNAALPTSAGVLPAPNTISTQIPTMDWVQQAITASIPAADNLTAVLTAGDNAGGLSITNLNGLTQTGTYNMTGSILQTDSSYLNQTISTGASTAISGGSVVNAAGTSSVLMGTNKFIISDTSSGTNELSINKSSISYDNSTGNADQLIISSTSTDNPILIQSTTTTGNATGIQLLTTTIGDDIIIETTSSATPPLPSNIQLITSGSTGAELGAQSSIILDTDSVFVRNGSLKIQADRNNFVNGLALYEITANNFAIINTGGSLQLGSNIVLSGSTTTISNPLTPTYSGATSTASQIGYTIITNLSGTASLPPTANVAANMNAGFVIPNGVWFVSLVAEVNYTIVGATTSYFAMSLSQSTGNMDSNNRTDYVAGLKTGDTFFNYPLIVNSTGGTYYIVGLQQGGTKTLDSLNYKITRIA